MGLHVNLNFAMSMQIFEELILHVQIEIDYPYPVGRTASKSFFKYKLYCNKSYNNWLV